MHMFMCVAFACMSVCVQPPISSKARWLAASYLIAMLSHAFAFISISWLPSFLSMARPVGCGLLGHTATLSNTWLPFSCIGGLLAVGFQDGALAVFGRYGWLRWHTGAVGAVKVLPHRMQVGVL